MDYTIAQRSMLLRYLAVGSLLALLTVSGLSCGDDSVPAVPSGESYFSGLESALEDYDVRRREIADEFNPQLPSATTSEDLNSITKNAYEAVADSFATLEGDLADLDPPSDLIEEHQTLLEQAHQLGLAYAGRVGAGTVERADISPAVDAFVAQCRSLQEAAGERGSVVELACAP